MGVEEAILAVGGDHAFPAAARVALAGGVGASVAGVAVVHRAAAQGLPTGVFALRLAVAAGLGALAASGLGPAAALAVASAALVALAVAETLRLPHPSSLPNEAGVS